jgi:hypothetical protein
LSYVQIYTLQISNQLDTYCSISYWMINKIKILMRLAQGN